MPREDPSSNLVRDSLTQTLNVFPSDLCSQPAEWAMYTVIAALKFALDENATLTYVTPDEAKHSILKTLNWFEAHDEYEWPDFSDRNYDFAQVMRLRRALVQDVFNALQQANQVKTGVPDSVTVVRRGIAPAAKVCAVQLISRDGLTPFQVAGATILESGSASVRPTRKSTPCLSTLKGKMKTIPSFSRSWWSLRPVRRSTWANACSV